MDWVKKHYDLAILALATLILASTATWIALQPNLELEGIPPTPQRTDKFDEPNLKAIEDAKAAAVAPARWQPDPTGSKGSLFVSRRYLLKDGKLLDPIEGGDNLHPPIPNAWFIDNGLDLSRTDILQVDDDGDNFTNLEEFEAKTNPKDKSSAPRSFTKLQLVAYKPQPFHLIFKGDAGTDGQVFQINFKDLKGAARTQFKKAGEQIDGAPYKIISYNFKPDRFKIANTTGDLSELIIENTKTGERLVLVYNQEINDPTSFGEFRNLITNEVTTLKKGDEFDIPPDKTKFKLIDIDQDSAQIQDVATGETMRISKPATLSP
jgi:hypothetical protein